MGRGFYLMEPRVARLLLALAVLAMCLLAPALGGAIDRADAAKAGASAETRPGAQAPATKASQRRIPALVVAAIRVGVPAAAKLAGKVVSKGRNTVKTGAKAAAARVRIPFKRIKRMAREVKRKANAILRSAAFKNKKWKRVARKIRRLPLYRPVRNCLITGVVAYFETRSLTKAAVACVVAFATSLRVRPDAVRAAPTPAAGAY